MIRYFSKESAIALKSASPTGLDLEGINIGAPVPYYAFTPERYSSIFQMRMRSVALFLDSIRNNNNSVTLLDIGCGNGANGRYIASQFLEHVGPFAQDEGERKIKVVFADVCEPMLDECVKRSEELQRRLPNFSFEVAQVDLHRTRDSDAFSQAYERQIDLCISIQFLYNTNLQLNRQRAAMFGKMIKPGGGMIIQCYRRSGFRSILGGYRRLLMRKSTWNSVALDHKIAQSLLKSHGFALAGILEQKFDPAAIKCDHFDQHMVELYFMKCAYGLRR